MKQIMHFTRRKPRIQKKETETIASYNMRHVFLKKVAHILYSKQKIIFVDEATFSYKMKFLKNWYFKYNNKDKYNNTSYKSVKLIIACDDTEIIDYLITYETINQDNFIKFIDRKLKNISKGIEF